MDPEDWNIHLERVAEFEDQSPSRKKCMEQFGEENATKLSAHKRREGFGYLPRRCGGIPRTLPRKEGARPTVLLRKEGPKGAHQKL